MNCDRCRELASEALDGALSGSLADGFRKHLEECPPCGTFLAELKGSLALLTELPEVTVDDRFDGKVWASIRASERAERRGWGRLLALPGGIRIEELFAWRWAPAMAVGAVIVALALSLGPNSKREELASANRDGAVTHASLPVVAPNPMDGAFEAPELNVRARMPEPVQEYLHQVNQELRAGTERTLGRANFFYPVRRLEVSGMQRPGARSLPRPDTADPRPAVIAF